MLQSGEDAFFSDNILVGIIENIKIQFPDAAVTLSIGKEKKRATVVYLMPVLDRFLIRHETADRNCIMRCIRV